VDVALDTFPYNGTTTTCEALWMGVPVVTLAGDRHASRVGASLGGAAAHADWIAGDWEEYVRKAAALAADRPQLATLRVSLRDDFRRSLLFDHAGQSARFGKALREMWRARLGSDTRATVQIFPLPRDGSGEIDSIREKAE
jgi:predicted O-linked N-acetylglucosamine transferase (SPINDLY family)